jgi:hypothetical protein
MTPGDLLTSIVSSVWGKVHLRRLIPPWMPCLEVDILRFNKFIYALLVLPM